MGIKKYFAPRQFYKHVFIIVAPIVIQQLLFSLGAYVDNIMVNAYGGNSVAYGGVSAANRLINIFNFLFLGLSAASSIYLSQYFGAGQKHEMKCTFNLAWISAIVIGGISIIAIQICGHFVVDTFIQSDASRQFGYDYLEVIKWGMIVWALNMAIATAFRTVKQTLLPMVVGIGGICMNTTLNFLLIFGNFGFPELGVVGAAIATVSSRVFEVVVLLGFAIFWKKSYFKKFWKHLNIKRGLIKSYIRRGIPIVANELSWSTFVAILIVFTTYKNDVWYTAYAYTLNIADLFFVFFAGLANGTAIIVGPRLGVDDFEGAKREVNRMKGLAVCVGVLMAGLMIALSSPLLSIFKPTAEVKKIGVEILIVVAIFLPVYSYNVTNFFALRSGGDSLRAFILDQGATILLAFPISVVMGVNSAAWGLTVVEIYLASHVADLVKIFVGANFVKKGKWLKNLTIIEE